MQGIDKCKLKRFGVENMMFKLVWNSQYGKEVIEDDIEDIKTARYLLGEYRLAFHDNNISIVRQYRQRVKV
jgi:hypothetical protein